mgnify:CR=1 FL=1
MSPVQNVTFDPRNTQSEKNVILEFEKKVSRYVKGNANNPEKLLSEIFELSVDYQNAVYPERFIKFLELQANAPAEILMILMSVCREYDFDTDMPETYDIWEFAIPANVIDRIGEQSEDAGYLVATTVIQTVWHLGQIYDDESMETFTQRFAELHQSKYCQQALENLKNVIVENLALYGAEIIMEFMEDDDNEGISFQIGLLVSDEDGDGEEDDDEGKNILHQRAFLESFSNKEQNVIIKQILDKVERLPFLIALIPLWGDASATPPFDITQTLVRCLSFEDENDAYLIDTEILAYILESIYDILPKNKCDFFTADFNDDGLMRELDSLLQTPEKRLATEQLIEVFANIGIFESHAVNAFKERHPLAFKDNRVLH